ncbi:TPA: hypothetical protein ROY01_006181, partial [Bacillus toyonensis]|nr:hypothetical protein [Bacillus toyonensis]
LAVTVFKPFKRTPNEIEPENIIVVSFDILGVVSSSGTENGDELAPSIFISFSTNQEVHPEKTNPLIKRTENHLHIYSEHRIKPIVFYELHSETLQVYFQMTSGTLYVN